MAYIFTIQVPLAADTPKPIIDRWEAYLKKNKYLFTKNKSCKTTLLYTISIESPQDAYWIGCNQVSLMHRLFDGPLTQTLG